MCKETVDGNGFGPEVRLNVSDRIAGVCKHVTIRNQLLAS